MASSTTRPPADPVSFLDEVGWMFNGQPQLAEQAQRVLELKGDLPLQRVNPALDIGVQVDDWSQAIYGWPRRRLRFVGSKIVAPVAAQRSQVMVYAPAVFLGRSRQSLIWIRRLHLSNDSATNAQFGMGISFAGPGGTGTPTSGLHIDDRSGGAGLASNATLGGGNAAASFLPTPTSCRFLYVPATSTVHLDVDYVLSAAQSVGGAFTAGLAIEVSGVNQGCTVSVEWEERAGTSSEMA